jgi:DNA polymerase III epsilon subunit-like protein
MAEVDESQVCFIDIETTGLDPQRHEIWEIGVIADGKEYEFHLPVTLSTADAAALRINRYYERVQGGKLNPENTAFEVARLTAGRMLVGAVPSFDAGFLDVFIRSRGYCPAWSHRLICVETLAAGKLGVMPAGLGKMAEKMGVPVDPTQAHTALGDARLAREIYRAVYAS